MNDLLKEIDLFICGGYIMHIESCPDKDLVTLNVDGYIYTFGFKDGKLKDKRPIYLAGM